MSAKHLEDVLRQSGDTVELLRNSQMGAYVYPVVAPEFTNWRDEQRAWRETAVLFDQSYHMAEIMVHGPEATKLLSYLAVNSFANFAVSTAKHFVPCNHDGYVISDGIIFRLEENRYNIVGRTPLANWIEFHCRSGDYDVAFERDERSPARPGANPVVRRHYRYQIQGPTAPQIFEKLNGGPLPDIKFFHVGSIKIAGREVPALRHGMAGAPGLEVWGPYEEGEAVKEAIIRAGQDFGLRQAGARCYSSNTLESGWIPSPLPAVYSGDGMKPYREWLPPNGYEAVASIGGSYVSDKIEDYYMSPYELGYGFYVKFDHDFVGRDALEKMAGRPHRKKVTFEWNAEDVAEVFRSICTPEGENYKYIDMPNCNYAAATYDSVTMDGQTVGFSMFGGYSFNERAMLSLGVVDPNIDDGDVLTLVWGEENGGTKKTTVEPHTQTGIRVKVSPVPYSRMARESYADGWRTRGRAAE